MDVHRLRTVSFNKTLSEKHVDHNKASHRKESRKSETSKSKVQKTEARHASKQRVSANSNGVDPSADIKTNILHSRVKEIFRKPTLTSSLDDFRKKSRHDPQENSKVKQRNKPRSKSTTQRNLKRKENFRHIDDINILYTSEEMKGTRQMDSKQKKQRKPKSIHVRKSSTDLFSTPNVSRLRNNVYMYYQTCKLQNASKRKRKRPVSREQCLRDIYHPEMNTGKQQIEDCFNNGPLHFNTIDYSAGDKVENSTQQSRHDFSNLCGDRETAISATSIVVPMACGDESCTRINEAIDTNALVTLVAQKVKKTKKKGVKLSKKDQNIEEVKIPCVESNPYPNAMTRFFESLTKGIKIILLVLTAIAWSPCIIIIFLCWAIVTPLTPEDIKAAEEIPTCPKCRSKFFAKVIQCVTRVYNKVMYTFEAVRNSLNIQQEEGPCSRVTTFSREKFNARDRCGFTPNKSTKQYVLYYAENKGWSIKPMQTQDGIGHKQKTSNVDANDIPKSRPEKSVTFWDSPKGVQDDNEDDEQNENTKTTTGYNIKPSMYEIKSPCICPVAPQTPTPDTCNCDHRDMAESVGYVTPQISRSFESEHIIRPCQHTGVRVPPLKSPRVASRRDICLDHKRLDHQLPCPGKQKKSSTCTCKPDKMRTQPPPKIRMCKCPKKKKKKKKKKLKQGNRKESCFQRFKGMFIKLNEVVTSAEQIWGPKSSDCHTLYMNTLRNKPCFWVYRCCPKLYPTVLSCSKMFDGCCQLMLYCCAACIWCPIFLCCYLCYVLTCQLIECC